MSFRQAHHFYRACNVNRHLISINHCVRRGIVEVAHRYVYVSESIARADTLDRRIAGGIAAHGIHSTDVLQEFPDPYKLRGSKPEGGPWGRAGVPRSPLRSRACTDAHAL